ncbi:hypothetical protein [Salipiger mucosus]|uniref:Uncharacterized protein n=1 Tax=Salipiger mucosus DSM 16094 TaxID=1123237 RepID=S9Q2W8_9RHOB|nr:hypothetical protein [Salipiger mucosus]EPX75641.1 hypothetical protein Salmuc_04559 [Salipiger mucosus DSM 16094]
MILKTTRIPPSDAGKAIAYLASPGENERVDWIAGSEDALDTMADLATIAGARYAMRHQIIASNERLSTAQLAEMVGDYMREFEVPASSKELVCIVRHTKARADEGDGNGEHYHVVFPEVSEEGAYLDDSWTHLRNEKLARLAELKFGHAPVPGRHNRPVIKALQEERPDLDLKPLHAAIAAGAEAAGADPATWRPRSAFTAGAHQSYQRRQRAGRDRQPPDRVVPLYRDSPHRPTANEDPRQGGRRPRLPRSSRGDARIRGQSRRQARRLAPDRRPGPRPGRPASHVALSKAGDRPGNFRERRSP